MLVWVTPVSFLGQVEEHTLQVVTPEPGRDLGRLPVGDDPPRRDEHDPLAEPLHLDHVVAGHEERGAVVGAQVVEAGADPQRDIRVQ